MINFVHVPLFLVQSSLVIYLATHFLARLKLFSVGQITFPGRVVGIMHISKKKKIERNRLQSVELGMFLSQRGWSR